MKRWIYLIKNKLNEKTYVGQSKDPSYRWRCHQRLALSGKIHPLYCSIRLHGAEQFELRILEECDEEFSDERECYWICTLKTCDRSYGYNIEPGGNGGKTISLETRQKMSRSRLGKQPTLGHKHSSETKLKMSLAHKGKAPYEMTDNVRRKISKAIMGENHPNFGRSLSDNVKARISTRLCQPVELLDCEGNVISCFSSAKEASEKTGVTRSVISVECKLGKMWRKASESPSASNIE